LAAAQRSPLLTVFLLALGVRLGLALVLHFGLSAASGATALFNDERAYHDVGLALADYWRGGPPVPASEQYLVNNYTYLTGALYYLLGPSPLWPKLMNAVGGAFCALLAGWLTGRYYPRPIAVLTALAVALWPSLVLWSVLHLKEIFSLVLALLVLLGIERFRAAPGWANGALVLLPLAALQNER
jgi:hypothetical protein